MEASHSEILCRGLSRPVFRELGDSENGAGQSLPQHRFLLIKCVNGHSFLQNQVAAAMTVCYNQSMELDSAEGTRDPTLIFSYCLMVSTSFVMRERVSP